MNSGCENALVFKSEETVLITTTKTFSEKRCLFDEL